MSTPTNALSFNDIPFHGMWIDQNGEKYISIMDEKNVLNLYPIRSKKFRNFLLRYHYKEHEKIYDEDAITSIAASFDAYCELEGKETVLSIRTAKFGAREICIDGINKTYLIDDKGWRSVDLERPLFVRPNSMSQLATPVEYGDIRKIFNFINIPNEFDQILFLTHLVYTLVPDRPHPVLAIFGPAGAAKSTMMKIYKKIVDPDKVDDVQVYSEKDFQLAALQRWVVCLDNVTTISQRFSDTLCKVVTGMGFTTRVLYTTDELLNYSYRRVIIVNGIGLAIDKPDLMDRSILISLDRIDNSIRKDEATLMQEFELVRGEILGGCFDALSKAISLLPTMPKTFNTRMTDFAQWGCAIALALGYTTDQFREAIDRNTARQNEEALDASPLVAVLNYWFGNGRVSIFRGTATDLLKQVSNYAEGAGINLRSLPNTPKSLGKKLMEIKPNLESEGYKVFFQRGKERIWIIEPPLKLVSKEPPSLASLKSQLNSVFPLL